MPWSYTKVPGTALTSMNTTGSLQAQHSSAQHKAVDSSRLQAAMSLTGSAYPGNSSLSIFVSLGLRYMHFLHHLAIQSTTTTADTTKYTPQVRHGTSALLKQSRRPDVGFRRHSHMGAHRAVSESELVSSIPGFCPTLSSNSSCEDTCSDGYIQLSVQQAASEHSAQLEPIACSPSFRDRVLLSCSDSASCKVCNGC